MKYAVIDIGSNSIRFVIQGKRDKLVITTRLAEGLARTGRLRESNMNTSISVIRALVNNARHMGLKPVAYATSAVRDAENKEDFIDRIKEDCNLIVDVLSGEREASYAFNAAAKHGEGLIDIGGGSFQIVTEQMRNSFPLGCVRGKDIAMELGVESCDERWNEQRALLMENVKGFLKGFECKANGWLGVGGTITCLAAFSHRLESYDADLIDRTKLTRNRIETLIEEIVLLGSKRQAEPMLAKRHDIILYGAAILTGIMDAIGIEIITVRTVDGMEGYLDYIVRKTAEDQNV